MTTHDIILGVLRRHIYDRPAKVVYTMNLTEMARDIENALRPSFSESIQKVAIPDQEFHGAVLDKSTEKRLRSQQERVENLMSDGKERTLEQIAEAVGGTQTAVSARLRDAENSGRWRKEKRQITAGLWSYRLTKSVC